MTMPKMILRGTTWACIVFDEGKVTAQDSREPTQAINTCLHRTARGSYRASEFAPRILADSSFKVAMKVCIFSLIAVSPLNKLKSDHPTLNSRHLLYEAQQAHFYGLPTHLAIASLTSIPAALLGLDHRVGFIRKGET